MTSRNSLVGFFAVIVLSLSFTACKDTKTLQQNQQLKAQVADLQKENGQLGNDVETLTAARDELTKENSALQAQVQQFQKRPATKTASRKRKRSRKSQQS